MSVRILPGHRYRVNRFDKSMDSTYRHKLMAMGMIPGAEFEVARIAPLGDPIQLLLHDYSLCLRAKDLCWLKLEEITA